MRLHYLELMHCAWCGKGLEENTTSGFNRATGKPLLVRECPQYTANPRGHDRFVQDASDAEAYEYNGLANPVLLHRQSTYE